MSQFENISNTLPSTPLAPINEPITAAQFRTHVNNAPEAWYTFLIELQTWFNDTITQYINWISACQQEHEQTQVELKQSQVNNETLSEMIQGLKSMSRIDIKSEKYSDSELYIEEREDKLNQFIFELTSKLKLNANRYSTLESRLLYGYSRLSGNAVAQALPRMTAQHDKLVTIEQLVALLRQAFDDSDKQGTAQRFISALRMRNRTFIEYLSDFQQHIDATGYDVVTRKFNLENELFSELKALLVQVNVSSLNYEQLIIKCQQLDSRYRATVQNLPKSKAVIHPASVIPTVPAYPAKYATPPAARKLRPRARGTPWTYRPPTWRNEAHWLPRSVSIAWSTICAYTAISLGIRLRSAIQSPRFSYEPSHYSPPQSLSTTSLPILLPPWEKPSLCAQSLAETIEQSENLCTLS